MKVAKYSFHLSFQLTGAKLFLSGSFKREGRKATYINMCKHVPHAREVSLRTGGFGKPKYSPSCRRSTACYSCRNSGHSFHWSWSTWKHTQVGTGSVPVVTQKIDLFYRSWKWREYFCPKSTLTWGPSNVSVLDTVYHAFLQRKETYTNQSFHIKYP